MGVCMAPEVRREIKQIEEIYHKTRELKQSKRVLVVGSSSSGKTELIKQAISTNDSYFAHNDEYLQFEYPMGPFTVSETAKPQHSLRTWEHRNDIISWNNTLSYYPAMYEDSESRSSSSSHHSLNSHNTEFDFDLLFTGFTRKYGDISFPEKVQDTLHAYFPHPEIQCHKDEIVDDNMVEFWELSSFDQQFWRFCVKQIVAIVFVVDISSFDEFYYDPKTYTKTLNKVTESIRTFKEMVHDTALLEHNNIAFSVMFNKMDVFKQKISRGISIRSCPEFKDYRGDEYDYTGCMDYVKSVFDDVSVGSERLVYLHETYAVRKDLSSLNLLGTIDENMSVDEIKRVWHKFGENLNYHWNLIEQC